MLDSQVERRLRAALITKAGGYLRNPMRRDGVTCAVCTTPVDGRYRHCYPCNQYRAHHGIADMVAPITYAIAGQQSGYVMRGYVEVRLTAAAQTSDARALDANHFGTGVKLPADSHVLLLDDTWTKGGHAQSAALALRRAGAGKVSVLVAARWIRRDFAGNARFLDGLPDYDPDICPWTGGVCPARG